MCKGSEVRGFKEGEKRTKVGEGVVRQASSRRRTVTCDNCLDMVFASMVSHTYLVDLF